MKENNMYYILDGKTPVPVEKMMDTNFMWQIDENGKDPRRVKEDRINGIHISTVFLVINHSYWSEDLPILFETMIFGGKYDEYQNRYSTWEEAEMGHQKAVDLVKSTPWYITLKYRFIILFINLKRKFARVMVKYHGWRLRMAIDKLLKGRKKIKPKAPETTDPPSSSDGPWERS